MDLIPVTYKQNLKCFSIADKFNSADKDIDVTILTKESLLLEINSGIVVCSLKLHLNVDDAEEILAFYSYDPKKKYYVIKMGSRVVVTKKNLEMLEVIKELNDVSSVKICDFYATGKPQMVFHYEKEGKQEVMDFCSGFSCEETFINQRPKLVGDAVMTATFQAQDVSLRLSKAQHLLMEKRGISTRLLFEFSSYFGSKDLSVQEVDNLVCVVGSFVSKENTLLEIEKVYSIRLSRPWHRFINASLLFGFHIENLRERRVENLELILGVSGTTTCTSKLLLSKMEENQEEDYEYVTCLPGHSSGFIIGWIHEPCFSSPKINVSGTLIFTLSGSEDIKQAQFDSVSVQVSDITSGKLQPSEQKRSEEDLVSLIATSEQKKLEIKIHSIQPGILDILTTFGFLNYHGQWRYIIYPFSSNRPFIGLLVKVIGKPIIYDDTYKVQKIIIYARDSMQLILFMHSLNSLLPDGSTILLPKYKYNNDDITNFALKKITEEVNHLSNELLINIPKFTLPLENSLQKYEITVKNWMKLLLALSDLEKSTNFSMRCFSK